jgi:hypothetical protein
MDKKTLIAAATLLLCVGSSSAAVVIGNYPPTNNNQLSGIGPTQAKAAGWTVPVAGPSYRFDSLTAQLIGFDAADAPLVRIFDDNGGVPGNAVLGLTNPTANTGSLADFTFTPNGDLVMAPGATYWLVFFVDTNISSTTFSWSASDPGIAPTGTFGNAGFLFASSPAGSWAIESSPIFNTYEVSASPVPAPAVGAVSLLLGTLIMAGLRRRAGH